MLEHDALCEPGGTTLRLWAATSVLSVLYSLCSEFHWSETYSRVQRNGTRCNNTPVRGCHIGITSLIFIMFRILLVRGIFKSQWVVTMCNDTPFRGSHIGITCLIFIMLRILLVRGIFESIARRKRCSMLCFRHQRHRFMEQQSQQGHHIKLHIVVPTPEHLSFRFSMTIVSASKSTRLQSLSTKLIDTWIASGMDVGGLSFLLHHSVEQIPIPPIIDRRKSY